MASAISAGQSTEARQSRILRPQHNRAEFRDARSMRRVIIKQGYLRKMPNAAKLGTVFKVIMTCFIVTCAVHFIVEIHT